MRAEIIDKMGDDLTVVNAARVSFDKASEWEYEETDCGDGCCWGVDQCLAEKDVKLINYLANHNHWTPFSHVQITMRETVPIFVARQRFKHVIGFSYNELSRRYVDSPPEFYVPGEWRKSADNKKQGSSDETISELKDSDGVIWELDPEYKYVIEVCSRLYQEMISGGVAPEQARMILPQSMMTSYYVTGSLYAWAHAYNLRSEEHSQKEIQDLAAQWHEIIGSLPELKHSWRALTNKKD